MDEIGGALGPFQKMLTNLSRLPLPHSRWAFLAFFSPTGKGGQCSGIL